MNIFTSDLLQHFATVARLFAKYRVEGRIDPTNGLLLVYGRNRYYRFFPQFICFEGGALKYSPQLEPTAMSFAGWRPYFNKRWDIAIDKLAFKDFCARTGIATPAMWRGPSPQMCDFLMKPSTLSFGKGLHGPFRSYDPASSAQKIPSQGGYYEAFIAGRIAKVWYWQDRVACLHVKPQASVTGDGKRKLRELLASRLRPAIPADEWEAFAEVAAYHGVALDDVPAAGRQLMVDYRYGTLAEPFVFTNANKVREMQGSAAMRQLDQYGPLLWQAIPEEMRPATLYSVDAIIDAQDRAWLLEVNCNPACHPDCYEPMFETLFGAPEAKMDAAVAPLSALPPYIAGGHVPPAAPRQAPPPVELPPLQARGPS
jgi:hypothetical protein